MILLCVALEAELPHNKLPHASPVIYTGVGKVQAATKLAQALCKATKPNLIVNYGTAGGLNPMLKGMYEIGTFVQRDMCAEPQAPRGSIPFSEPLIGDIKTASPKSQVRCGTGDSFVMEPDPWYVTYDVDCVDMEGWALAYVAKEYGIPFRSFKYISDMADENAAEEWAKNVADGADKFLEIYSSL